jgi:hypothetical protein
MTARHTRGDTEEGPPPQPAQGKERRQTGLSFIVKVRMRLSLVFRAACPGLRGYVMAYSTKGGPVRWRNTRHKPSSEFDALKLLHRWPENEGTKHLPFDPALSVKSNPNFSK